MSHIPTTSWLEAAKQNFDEQLEARNWNSCLATMHDIKEKGFIQEYRHLMGQYNHERFYDK